MPSFPFHNTFALPQVNVICKQCSLSECWWYQISYWLSWQSCVISEEIQNPSFSPTAFKDTHVVKPQWTSIMINHDSNCACIQCIYSSCVMTLSVPLYLHLVLKSKCVWPKLEDFFIFLPNVDHAVPVI